MEAVLVLLTVVVAPVWIIAHYITKNRALKTLSPEDEVLLSDLWQTAKKMEERIQTLEKILDSQAPDWRRNEP